MAVPLTSAADVVVGGLDEPVPAEPVTVPAEPVPPVELIAFGALLPALGVAVASLGAALVETALTVGVAEAVAALVGVGADEETGASVATGADVVVADVGPSVATAGLLTPVGAVVAGLAAVLETAGGAGWVVAGPAGVEAVGVTAAGVTAVGVTAVGVTAAGVAASGVALVMTPAGLLAASVADVDDPPLRLAATTTPAMARMPTTPTISGQPPRRLVGPAARTDPPPAPAAVGRRGGWLPPLDGPEDPPDRPLGPGRLGGGFLLAISPPPIARVSGRSGDRARPWYRAH